MKTAVVKLGSTSVADRRGRLRRSLLVARVAEIADLVRSGQRVVVVSSGAIACGQTALGLRERPHEMAALQAASAVGQGRLFAAYAHLFRRRGVTAAQVLLTSTDFAHRASYVNARATLRRLVAWGIVPVVNENDTTATDEIRFGDNDVLAAQVAIMLRADLLLLLTDRAGLYTADPERWPEARLISRLDDPTVLARIDTGRVAGVGAGGMAGKAAAALMAAGADTLTVIAAADEEQIVTRALAGDAVGTTVPARPTGASAFKLWLRYAKPVRGTVEVDSGAARALAEGGGSLLPVGVRAVHGSFAAGDAVAVLAPGRRVIAHGLANLGARDLRRVAGLRSDDARRVLPHADGEFVHRDQLVLIQEEV